MNRYNFFVPGEVYRSFNYTKDVTKEFMVVRQRPCGQVDFRYIENGTLRELRSFIVDYVSLSSYEHVPHHIMASPLAKAIRGDS
jgi:hypothetical protein